MAEPPDGPTGRLPAYVCWFGRSVHISTPPDAHARYAYMRACAPTDNNESILYRHKHLRSKISFIETRSIPSKETAESEIHLISKGRNVLVAYATAQKLCFQVSRPPRRNISFLCPSHGKCVMYVRTTTCQYSLQ